MRQKERNMKSELEKWEKKEDRRGKKKEVGTEEE